MDCISCPDEVRYTMSGCSMCQKRQPLKLNRKHKNGSWSLHSDYMNYRDEGGIMSPDAWNSRIRELKKEKRVVTETTKKVEP